MTTLKKQADAPLSSSTWRSSTSGKVSKASVNYREGTDPEKTCHTCSMSSGPEDNRRCSLVRGQIHSGDVCDKWDARTIPNPLTLSTQVATSLAAEREVLIELVRHVRRLPEA